MACGGTPNQVFLTALARSFFQVDDDDDDEETLSPTRFHPTNDNQLTMPKKENVTDYNVGVDDDDDDAHSESSRGSIVIRPAAVTSLRNSHESSFTTSDLNRSINEDHGYTLPPPPPPDLPESSSASSSLSLGRITTSSSLSFSHPSPSAAVTSGSQSLRFLPSPSTGVGVTTYSRCGEDDGVVRNNATLTGSDVVITGNDVITGWSSTSSSVENRRRILSPARRSNVLKPKTPKPRTLHF